MTDRPTVDLAESGPFEWEQWTPDERIRRGRMGRQHHVLDFGPRPSSPFAVFYSDVEGEGARLAALVREQLIRAASRPVGEEGLRAAARAYLDAEMEPAYSWVIESQTARAENRPNREVERMERIARARVRLEEALSGAALATNPNPEPEGLDAALIVARRFDPDAFACDFGGQTAMNLPNLDLVIPLLAQQPETEG